MYSGAQQVRCALCELSSGGTLARKG
ncbi:MAG: hypothetical protein E6I91_08325 [Chloroflexi bacterium]|nr:MAG: hypothetical protein E6I91_08325 [Chloroflexota bacterium]